VQDCEVLVFDPSREWTLNDAINVIKKQKNNKAIDIKGFFQFHSSEFLPYIDLFKNVFTLNDSLKKIINAALEKHKAKGTNIISIHMRRGDYENYSNNPLFWTTPTDSILNSLRSIKSSNFQKELIYIASDNISCCKQEFDSAGIEYITADDLFAFEDENTRLLVDFTIFSTAQACIISNSSLSFFGSLMNKESKIFLRPLPDENILTPYAPWNSSVLLRKSF
jgi:hypothetical protein